MKNKLGLVAILCAIFFTTVAHADSPKMLKKCQTCHGKQLSGKKKSPSIVGFSYEELYTSLTTDIPKKMRRVSNKLTDAQKIELSKYISNLGKLK